MKVDQGCKWEVIYREGPATVYVLFRRKRDAERFMRTLPDEAKPVVRRR